MHGLALEDAPAVLAIDVGGATTELTLGRGIVIEDATSLPVGALALTELAGRDLARARASVAAAVATTDLTARAAARSAVVVASGGTATALAALALGLARYDPRRVHGTLLETDRLASLAADAAGAPIDPGRAAILPAGACILDGVMRATSSRAMRVSDHGVRHAYLREALARRGVHASMRRLWD